MTFLKGASTWGRLEHDLTRLICGEIADDYAVTAASGDKWLREVTRSVSDGVLNSTTTVTSATAAFVASDVGSLVIATGIPIGTTISSVTNGTTIVLSAAATASASGVTLQIATNTIKTPAAKDVASGAMSNRCGYFTNGGVATGAAPFGIPATAGGGSQTVAKVTSPYTADPSSSGFHRWVVSLSVATVNSVSGNYSTASISRQVLDADSGAVLVSTALTPNAAGDVTVGTGCVVNITDPSGFLTANTRFVRAFTSTYMYGIDHWPMLYRASGAHTFSVAPPGVNATDYDVVKLPIPPITNLTTLSERGNLFHGLGIKTATGLGANPLYTLSFPMALMKGRIFSSGTAGILSLDVGQSQKDAVNGLSTLRNVGGVRISSWIKAFTTAGSVTSSSVVTYWISVTNDGIALVLNGDPGSTGKLACAWYGAFTPYDTVYDAFPISFSYFPSDYTSDNFGLDFALATQYEYYSLRRRQDGSEGARDWQTKWMRGEHLNGPATSGQYATDISSTSQVAAVMGTSSIQMLSAIGHTTGTNFVTAPVAPARENKPGVDGKWWLYGFQYGEGNWLNTASTGGVVDEIRHVRGSVTTRFFFVPDGGWASGDELTDSVTGTKYLLLTPDYMGMGGRMRTATSIYYGGLAVAEL